MLSNYPDMVKPLVRSIVDLAFSLAATLGVHCLCCWQYEIIAQALTDQQWRWYWPSWHICFQALGEWWRGKPDAE